MLRDMCLEEERSWKAAFPVSRDLQFGCRKQSRPRLEPHMSRLGTCLHRRSRVAINPPWHHLMVRSLVRAVMSLTVQCSLRSSDGCHTLLSQTRNISRSVKLATNHHRNPARDRFPHGDFPHGEFNVGLGSNSRKCHQP